MLRIILVFFLIFFSCSSGAKAFPVEFLYKSCSEHVEKNFKSQGESAVACISYFAAAIEISQYACSFWRADGKKQPLITIIASGATGKNLDAYLQQFVNDAKRQPHRWDHPAHIMVVEALKKVSPC